MRTPVRYRALRTMLTGMDRLIGWRSRKIRGTSRYLVGLIDQGRCGEASALIAHGLRKLTRRRAAEPFGTIRPHWRALTVDSATQRLDAAGRVVAKRSWVYPSTDAAVLASIVIPCYNYGRYLLDAVSSARSQTIAACEIIVVDDGSTDSATIAVIQELQAASDVRVVRQANGGLPAARNAGIAVASGEFICCLDADDVLDPTYLECATARLLTDHSIGFAYSYVRFFGDVDEVWETHDFDMDEALIANFTAVSAVFRRDDWAELDGYAPEMRGGFEDWEFWIRLACLGRRGRVLRQPLFLHRRHGRTMTSAAKERYDELHALIRTRNPDAFGSAALRRRLKRLAPPKHDAKDALLPLSAALVPDSRPGLLVVMAWARRGGAETLLLTVLRELSPRWRIVLVTTEDDPHAMTEQFRPVTQDIFHLSGMFDSEERLAFLVHLCRSRKVTHGISSGSAWLLTALRQLKSNLPSLRWAHITHNEVPDRVFRAAVAAGSAIDRHVAVSRSVARGLADADIDAARITRIDNGIDPAPFAQAALHRDATRLEFGIAPGDRMLLWVGRFAPEKRPELFVATVAALRNLPVRGIMVGEGPLEPETDSAIRASGMEQRLARLGYRTRDEVASLLAAGDLLVMTSTHEGLPLVVLEALAAGCPVVATDVGDIASVVCGGETGALVDPARPELLALAAREILRREPDQEARARIQRDFAAGRHTAAAMSEAYAAMLEALR